MTRYLFALFIALLIHIFIIILFLSLDLTSIQKNISSEKRVKISLKELHIEKAKPKNINKTTKLIKKKVIKKALPIPKGTQLKKLIKIKPKPNIVKKKDILQKQEHKDPMSWLYEDRTSQEKKEVFLQSKNKSSINQNIKELYGSTFSSLSKSQQEYILDNQEIMRRITQQVLNRVASVNLKGNINVNTSNVVEFYLHPNGDMTDFKFLDKSGYFELDDTTKETIEYAYSKYPRTKEKTLIRYNVFYNLRH